MHTPRPLTRDLVFVGGGHTHALVLKRWGMRPVEGVRLTLINPAPIAPYTGMLPGHIAGHYRREELDIDLVRLARFAGARLILGIVDGLDRAAGTVHVAGRGDVAFDVLSLDYGVGWEDPGIPGYGTHAIPVKPMGPFARAWERFVAEAPKTPRIAVIGGGVAGVEIAMAMHHRMAGMGRSPSVSVLERGQALATLARRPATLLRQRLETMGISLREGATVASATAEGVCLADGEAINADFVVAAGGARPQSWIAGSG
ncbi:MAG: FAD-dependent oxidoreductase, partial [Pseudomonadota bacterium]